MDTLAALRVFTKVVEHGSFAKAAERLDMSTSAVSRLLAQLEAHLDARLLNRTTRRLSLTESGEAFFERSTQILSDLEEAEALAAMSTARPRGTLKLTCAIAFGVRHLAPVIGRYQLKYPETKFDISLSDHFVDLIEAGMDLAIRIGEGGNANLIAKKIGETRLVACAAPAYLKKHGTPKHPDALSEHNCFTYAYSTVRDHWQFRDKTGKLIDARVSGSIHTNSGEMSVAIAEQGAGIALEPDFMVTAAIAAGRLVRILDDFTPKASVIYAVYPSRRHLSAKVRTFIDFLAGEFDSRQAWK